ncbi:DNA alkylation repair protein [Leptospira levettii]|uniref:DNA alkylation repair protein n=1 Tax=Leptospira levettii TaxID=2023178 RepID=A0A6H3ND08_9LEPT|nr:DNA alkylation repair protein [Leptospira levettii]MCW7467128.1 DNA alkylation repair protein [Leptospira levettii]MCW7497755.1 DNA alkylation repair protein [Leptospira levettii]MCW7512850.1 DNA alkylation repair protein [Leptospira levettii]MCW7516572.1 DNA alkylation repair protein [Leptospira levettii]TGL68438.1 DNA alkylation repair protein [Leptospira levettii]
MKETKEFFLEELNKHKDLNKAKFFPRFFKTGPGEYGEGDLFLGITVPKQRLVAKKFAPKLSLDDLQSLIVSPYHEVRLTTLLILIQKYQTKKITEIEKEKIVKFYLKNTKYINNWDLVDVSADKIIGDYYFDKNNVMIQKLKNSKDLWENRIAILSTFHWIRKGRFEETLMLCEHFLNHNHDLIHKATGWMLREIGKRDIQTLRTFLKNHATKMPRTMLRYAIEKLTTSERKKWLELKMEN